MCYMIRDSETHGRVKVVYLGCISGTVGRWDTALNYIPIYFFTNLLLLGWENTTSGFPNLLATFSFALPDLAFFPFSSSSLLLSSCNWVVPSRFSVASLLD
jgi:hypothetical protein